MIAQETTLHATARPHGRLERFLREYPGWASFVALAVGDLVLFGWRFDVEPLKRVGPGFAGMNPMTALALAFSGLSLWLLRDRGRDAREPRLGRAFAIAIASIAALRLIGYLAGWDRGIDTWVFAEKLNLAAGDFRNRMAPSAALAFLLIGASLAAIDVRTRRGRRPAEPLALGAVLFAIFGATGPVAMELPTAVVLLALGLGVLCARAGEGYVALLTSDTEAERGQAGDDLLRVTRDELIGRNDLDFFPREAAGRASPQSGDASSRRALMTGDQICRDLDQLKETGAPFEAILERAVHRLHESHPRFHWTGIYELFPDDVLRLGTFIGAPTDHVFIGVGQGVCGTAVAEKRNINVPDVSKVSNYLACSTSTKSELVVLIRLGDTIFAQIDVDSHECNAFDAASVENVERVAAWLAAEYARRRTSVANPAASPRR